jgi:hypothetical protein
MEEKGFEEVRARQFEYKERRSETFYRSRPFFDWRVALSQSSKDEDR